MAIVFAVSAAIAAGLDKFVNRILRLCNAHALLILNVQIHKYVQQACVTGNDKCKQFEFYEMTLS